MAPLPQNNTNRFFLKYTNGANEHVLAVRGGLTDAWLNEVRTAVGAFFQAIGLLLPAAFDYQEAYFQVKDTNFTFPTTLPPFPTALGSGTVTGNDRAWQWRYEGRSQTFSAVAPRKVSLSIFGLQQTPPGDFRVATEDDPILAAGLEVLNDTTTYPNSFVAINGERALFYPYVNFNYNSYWERSLRA